MSCISQIAGIITPDCEDPKIAGFSERAIIYGAAEIPSLVITTSANTPATINDISFQPDTDELGVRCTIYGENPYNGTNTALTREDGVEKYIHQVGLRVANRGSDKGHDIIEPLARGRHVVVQLTNDNRVFIHGLHGVLKATEQTQNEYENNGDWMVTLQSKEPYPVVEVVSSGQSTALAVFERLWSKASQE